MSLELKKRAPMLLQFTVIVLISASASYTFQSTETVYQINGVCVCRYLEYIIAVFLGYVSFSHYKKHIALAFSLTLSAVGLSPIGQKAIELFPLVIPLLAVLMGVTTVLSVPSSRGRGFFEFLFTLILPALLAESRIGGTYRLLATAKSIGFYELSAITVSVVGGYFYLRYAALANLNRLELLSNGGNEKDVGAVSNWCNLITVLIVIGASGIAASLMVTVPIVADALRATATALPIYVLALAMGAGISMATILYIFQHSYKEPTQTRLANPTADLKVRSSQDNSFQRERWRS